MKNFKQFVDRVVSLTNEDIDQTTNLQESAQLVRSAGFKTARPPRTFGDFADIMRNEYEEVYTEDGKWMFKMYGNRSFTITDIADAMQTGKQCAYYTVEVKHGDPSVGLFNVFDGSTPLTKVVEMIKAGKLNGEVDHSLFNTYSRTHRSVDMFNPFALGKLKRVTNIPSRMTINHVIKMIANGQFSYLGRDYKYTDDYALDAANNHGKIENGVNPIALVQRMIGDRWSVWLSSRGEQQVIHFGPHSAESWTLVPDLQGKLRLRV